MSENLENNHVPMTEELSDQSSADLNRERQLRDEYKKLKKKNHPRAAAAKRAIIAFFIGAIVGVMGVIAFQINTPKQVDEPVNVSIVMERVMEQNELVAASQKYSVVEKVRDAKKFFDWFEIPFTENSFWYRYVGTIKAAVDLSKLKLVEQNGTKITVSLEQPYISSNTPDMNESCALEENNNILNPIEIKDVDAYKKQCIEKVEQAAKEGDLFAEAKRSAAEDLSKLFTIGLGEEYEVTIQWEG